MKVLIIDNYDSFTYNLYQLVRLALGDLDAKIDVVRNNEISLEEIAARRYHRIIISPGPGGPSASGVSRPVVQKLHKEIPILGVCLGHQVIGAAFGGEIIRAQSPQHGKTSLVFHQGTHLFDKIPNPFQAMRYHSLIVDRASVSAELEITAELSDGTIMGLSHRTHPLHGVQFHPESFLTSGGISIISKFLMEAS